MPGTTLEKMATDGDDKSDDSTRSVIDYKSMEITCIDDEKEQGLPTDTILECFEYARKEYPDRTTKYSSKTLLAASNGIDFYSGKVKEVQEVENFVDMTLTAKGIDTILQEICQYEDKAEERTLFLSELTDVFKDELLTLSEVETYHKAILINRKMTDNGSGGENDAACTYAHIPRAIRWILYTNQDWRGFNFNRRRALIRHLMTEYPVEELIAIHNYAKNKKTRMTVKNVSICMPRMCVQQMAQMSNIAYCLSFGTC